MVIRLRFTKSRLEGARFETSWKEIPGWISFLGSRARVHQRREKETSSPIIYDRDSP